MLTTGITGAGAKEIAADLGGSPSKYFGYRVNLLREVGNGPTSGSTLGRTLGSVALDIHPTDRTTLELNASYYRFEKYGYPGGFSYSEAIALPSALDAAKAGYGQTYGGSTLQTRTLSAKLLQDLGGGWKLSAGISHQEAYRRLLGVTNTLNANGTYTASLSRTGAAASKFDILSNLATLNGRVSTGSVTHDIVIGTSGYSWDIDSTNTTGITGATATLGTASLANPRQFAPPSSLYNGLPLYKASTTQVQNAIVGDTITWNRYLQTVLSGSYNHFHYNANNTLGQSTSSYTEGGFSGSAALVVKPVENVSAYLSYSDTLEIGGVAPTTALNNGEVLAPVRSRQTELGVKTRLGGIDLNAALFRISRPMAYTDASNIYREEGLQRNNGAELFASGSITPNLRVYGGLTYLDAVLKNAYSASADGGAVVGVPHLQANLLVDYTLPMLHRVSVNANLHYVGRRAANDINSSWAAAYATVDLGARYVDPNFHGHRLSVNLIVDNITNRNYWASIFPGSIYGSNGADTAFLGEPRTLRLTTSVSF